MNIQSSQKKILAEKARELKKEGLKLRQISKIVGMSHEWVRNQLEREKENSG